MPKTRGESIFFTSITAWMMVYVMTLYNTVLATGTFTNLTFFIALKNMWIEYIIIGYLLISYPAIWQKVCFPRRAAGRPTNLYYFCNPDLHGYLAGCIRQCDQCISRTRLYRQFYTGLSYHLLQKFYPGIPTAADLCRASCKIYLPDAVYQP